MINLLTFRACDRAWRFCLGALIAFVAVSGPCAAQSTFDVTILAGACANCHGTNGRATGSIPTIAGRPENTILNQLLAYKSETPPPGTTIMNRLAKGYSDQELAALAKHFSNMPAETATSSEGARK